MFRQMPWNSHKFNVVTSDMDLTQSNIILPDVKTTLQLPSLTRTQLYIYISTYSKIACSEDRPHSPKSLPVIARVVCYFSTLLPNIICPYNHNHKDRGVLGYKTQDSQCGISSS